jgi:hypothetical protein
MSKCCIEPSLARMHMHIALCAHVISESQSLRERLSRSSQSYSCLSSSHRRTRRGRKDAMRKSKTKRRFDEQRLYFDEQRLSTAWQAVWEASRIISTNAETSPRRLFCSAPSRCTPRLLANKRHGSACVTSPLPALKTRSAECS